MRPFSLRIGPAWGGLPWHRLQASSRRPSTRTNSSSNGAAAGSRGSYLDRVKGWQGPWKAGITSGGLSAMGDLLAQFLSWQAAKHDETKQFTYDPTRTARMLGFGFFWYGPLQYYWYNFLDWTMPIKTTVSFISKVAANQLILAPVVLSTVFAWNLSLTGNAAHLQSKLQNDLMPTMMNGWKFWVPAASLNFYAIPVQQQVLYMSACGILWTAYLSYASATEVAQRPAAPAAQPAPAPAVSLHGRKK